MKTIHKLTLAFFIFALVILFLFFYFSDKVSVNNVSGSQVSSNLSKEQEVKNNIQENEYIAGIKIILANHKEELDKIDNEILKNKNSSFDFTVIDLNNFYMFEKELSEIRVPKKFKEYHLLLSRSFQTIFASLENKDMFLIKNGLKLFQDSNTELLKLTKN